jgi:cell division protease FtsH
MYSRAKIDYSQLQNDASGEHTLRQVEEKSDELYNYTLTSIRDYEDVIVAIKDTLLDQYVLSKDAVFELLEQHKDALAANLTAPRHASLKLCEEAEEAVA